MARWLPESLENAPTKLCEDIHAVLNDWRERGEADQGVAIHPSGTVERLRENVHRTLGRVLPGSRRQEEISWRSVFDTGGPPIDVEEGDDEIVVTAGSRVSTAGTSVSRFQTIA